MPNHKLTPADYLQMIEESKAAVNCDSFGYWSIYKTNKVGDELRLHLIGKGKTLGEALVSAFGNVKIEE